MKYLILAGGAVLMSIAAVFASWAGGGETDSWIKFLLRKPIFAALSGLGVGLTLATLIWLVVDALW